MNGQTIPSTGEEPDVIVTDGENIRYGEKKKLSLTLPLLNVIVTNAANEEEQNDMVIATTTKQNNEEKTEANDSIKLEVSGGESSKMKKIYESDDTFIQTIFSQTIKSTTATPTDDEPSLGFADAFKQSTSSAKTSQDDNDADAVSVNSAATSDVTNVPADDKSESISKEPAAIYTYFHQTIEEDDSPDDLYTDLDKTTTDIDLDVDDVVVVTNESATVTDDDDAVTTAVNSTAAVAAAVACNPIHTLTTTLYTHNDIPQINICTEVKDDFSDAEKDCGGASYDNSLNNTSTAFASNEAISESEHSLTQLNSLESDVSVPP